MNVSFFSPFHLASTKNQIRNNTVIKKFKDNTHTILLLNNIESRPFFFPLHSNEYIFFCFFFSSFRMLPFFIVSSFSITEKLKRDWLFLIFIRRQLFYMIFFFLFAFVEKKNVTWNCNIDWMKNMNCFLQNGKQTGKKSFNSLKNIHFSTFCIHYHNGSFFKKANSSNAFSLIGIDRTILHWSCLWKIFSNKIYI